MSRFLAWFRWEWREHAKLVIGCALAAVFIAWVALLVGGRSVGRGELEGVLVGTLGVIAVVLTAGLFSHERRHGAESLVLRTPGARLPLCLARLAYVASALALVAAVASFGAAQVAHLAGSERASLQAPALGAFLWPRWIVADLLPLVVAFGAVTALVSTWTRRVALAFVLGFVLPIVVLFPWIYLGARRGDFFPFWRPGAPPFAAWPLAGLAILALLAAWFLGRRRMNRPWRPVLSGALVLLLGMGIAGGWTAVAFARFDDLRGDQPGFRLTTYPIERYDSGARHAGAYGFLPLDTIALTPDGRSLWIHGLRRDAGPWPGGRFDTYGPAAMDFRTSRGTWSKQFRIDLETGEAQGVVKHDVRDRIMWWDPGAGTMHGLLTGVDLGARLAPRRYALFGVPGQGDLTRMLDLQTGAQHGRIKQWSRDDLLRHAGRMRADTTAVRDAQGRPAWLEFEGGRMSIVTPDGRTAVDDPLVTSAGRHGVVRWHPVLGGWVRDGGHGQPRVATLDTQGRVRKATRAQLRQARIDARRPITVIDPRRVITQAWRDDDSQPTTWVTLDLEDGTVGAPVPGPSSPVRLLARPIQPDGRLIAFLDAGDGAGRRLALWDPSTGATEALAGDGVPSPLPQPTQMILLGGHPAGHAVIHLARVGPPVPDGLATMHSLRLYFDASTRRLHRLDIADEDGGDRAPHLEPLGIDGQRRLVYLLHRVYEPPLVVRLDPADGSRTILFPKAERGPLE